MASKTRQNNAGPGWFDVQVTALFFPSAQGGNTYFPSQPIYCQRTNCVVKGGYGYWCKSI